MGVGREGDGPVGLDASEEAFGWGAERDQAERVADLVGEDGGKRERAELDDNAVAVGALAGNRGILRPYG